MIHDSNRKDIFNKDSSYEYTINDLLNYPMFKAYLEYLLNSFKTDKQNNSADETWVVLNSALILYRLVIAKKPKKIIQQQFFRNVPIFKQICAYYSKFKNQSLIKNQIQLLQYFTVQFTERTYHQDISTAFNLLQPLTSSYDALLGWKQSQWRIQREQREAQEQQYQGKIKTYQSTIKELRLKNQNIHYIQQLEGQISNLKEKMSVIDSDYQSYMTKNQTLLIDISNFKISNDELATQLYIVQTQLKKVHEQANQLRSKVKALEGEQKTLLGFAQLANQLAQKNKYQAITSQNENRRLVKQNQSLIQHNNQLKGYQLKWKQLAWKQSNNISQQNDIKNDYNRVYQINKRLQSQNNVLKEQLARKNALGQDKQIKNLSQSSIIRQTILKYRNLMVQHNYVMQNQNAKIISLQTRIKILKQLYHHNTKMLGNFMSNMAGLIPNETIRQMSRANQILNDAQQLIEQSVKVISETQGKNQVFENHVDNGFQDSTIGQQKSSTIDFYSTQAQQHQQSYTNLQLVHNKMQQLKQSLIKEINSNSDSIPGQMQNQILNTVIAAQASVVKVIHCESQLLQNRVVNTTNHTNAMNMIRVQQQSIQNYQTSMNVQLEKLQKSERQTNTRNAYNNGLGSKKVKMNQTPGQSWNERMSDYFKNNEL